MDKKKVIEKAAGGDEDALHLVILLSPSGAIGGMQPHEYAKKMHEDPDARARDFGADTDTETEDEDEDVLDDDSETREAEAAEPDALMEIEKLLEKEGVEESRRPTLAHDIYKVVANCIERASNEE